MSGLFGSPAQAQQETYAGMQVSTSIMGNVIPYIAGRTRITANLGWYGNFAKNGSNSSGKGGGGAPGSATYSAAWIGILCLGPITNVYQVFHDRSLVTLAYENLSVALGTTGQAVWSGYPSGTPAGQQIPYSNLAYVATPLYNFGSSPSMPNLTYETEAGGIVAGYSDAHGMYDADCSKIVTDYLTNSVYGAGFQGTINAALLTGTSNTFQAYCMALGILTSPYENNQRAATDFITELMQICNSDIVLSCGDLRVIPYADTAVSGTTADGTFWSYTPNLTPLFAFGEGDYCPRTDEKGVPLEEPVILKRKPARDIYNVLSVEYLDRSNYYNPTPAWASDNSDIAKRGPKAGSTITLHQITNAITAKQAAQMILNWQLYERNSYVFRVRFDYWPLEPMDLVSITDSGQQLVNQVCRITEVAEDSDGFLTMTVMEVPGTIRNTPQYNWNPSQGYAQNFDAVPGSVLAPAIFAMPPIAAVSTAGITLGIAVGPAASSSFWGGCYVYASVDGGTTYELVGEVGPNGPARYGTITANLPLVADPDTSSTLSILLNNTTEQISTAVTHAEADSMQTLCLIGSGSTVEVVSFGAASLVSAGVYNLSYLRRGQYQTSPHLNNSGAQFVRLDGSIFTLPVDTGMAGVTITFKFTSYNSVHRAVEALSAVTAYSYTIPANFGGAATNNQTWDSGGNVSMLSPTSAFKLPNSANAWDSSIYSTLGYANGCTVQAYPIQTTAQLMIGLTATPLASNSYTNLNYAFYCAGSGTLQIYEGGSAVMTVAGGYTTSTLLQIVYDGKHISYWAGGSLIRTVSTPSGNQTYFAQFCFSSPGGGIYGMDFSSSSLATQPFTLVPMTVNVAASGTLALPNTQGSSTGSWGTRCFKTVESYSAGASLSFSFNPGGAAIIGLTTSPATGDTTGTAINIAEWDVNNVGSNAQCYFGSTSIYTGSAPTINDVYTIEYDTYSFYWYKNNALVAQKYYPQAGALQVFGDFFYNSIGALINIAFLDNGQLAPNPFVGRGNVVTHDATASKIGGTSGWDSDFYSLNGYATCHVVFKTNDLTGLFMIGLSTSPHCSYVGNYNTLNYCIYCNSGTAYIFESGTNVTSIAAYATTDLFAITYDGSNVKYWYNGTNIRTVALSGSFFYCLGAFYTSGAACNNLEFGPGAVIPLSDTYQIGANAVSTIGSTSSATAVTSSGSINTLQNLTVISLTVACTGSPIEVDASCTALITNTTGGSLSVCNMSIWMDGAIVPGIKWDPTNGGGMNLGSSNCPAPLQVTLVVTNTPASGNHTFTLNMATTFTNSGSGAAHCSATNNFLKVREIKR